MIFDQKKKKIYQEGPAGKPVGPPLVVYLDLKFAGNAIYLAAAATAIAAAIIVVIVAVVAAAAEQDENEDDDPRARTAATEKIVTHS